MSRIRAFEEENGDGGEIQTVSKKVFPHHNDGTGQFSRFVSFFLHFSLFLIKEVHLIEKLNCFHISIIVSSRQINFMDST